jgi:hypothetical protein
MKRGILEAVDGNRGLFSEFGFHGLAEGIDVLVVKNRIDFSHFDETKNLRNSISPTNDQLATKMFKVSGERRKALAEEFLALWAGPGVIARPVAEDVDRNHFYS